MYSLDVPRGPLHHFSQALIARVEGGTNHSLRHFEGVHLYTVELTSESDERIVALVSNALDDCPCDPSDVLVH
jgi:hypothetical protein